MESIWSKSCQIRKRDRLTGDLETEVAVIGAGMAGVLTAYQLQKAGKRVAVLEADRVGSGQTRNTTAKITAQHGLIYHRLIREQGEEKARQYANANMEAIREYRRVVAEENIACDFEETCAYVYGGDVEQLKQETEAASRLDLPASFVTGENLPIPTAGAVRMEGQAQFDPLKFLRAVSDQLTIYENTPVRTVESDCLTTDTGTVRAAHIVFACHYPFVNFPGMYFARMHQERSYVLALKGAPKANGMFIGVGEHGYSLRDYGDLLLFGGEGHRTGENTEGGRYDALLQAAEQLFPGCRETARWSAQDCVTADGVPYIGRYASGQPNWYVATGFRKWGMTSSMASALLLRDLICSGESPWAEVFDPGRFDWETLPKIAGEGGQAVKGLAKQIFQIPAESAGKIPPGHGGVVLLDGEKAGVYKDENGILYPVDIRCPHLGCQLEWNPDEHSWDCPCHGSRFDRYGKLLSGPAQENLARE